MKFDIEKSLDILQNTPSVLRNLIGSVSEEWTYPNEGKDTWSAYDVLGHLVHGEKTDWVPRLLLLHKNDRLQTFESYDRFAQFEMSKGKTLADLLDEFESLRKTNLSFLKKLKLTEKDLTKRANHPSLGSVTMSELLATWTVHDLGHIAQISRVMAKQYKNEVGPWTKYLTILHHLPKE